MNTDVINTFEKGTGNWFWISVFFFILLCLTMFFLAMRIREVIRLKKITEINYFYFKF